MDIEIVLACKGGHALPSSRCSMTEPSPRLSSSLSVPDSTPAWASSRRIPSESVAIVAAEDPVKPSCTHRRTHTLSHVPSKTSPLPCIAHSKQRVSGGLTGDTQPRIFPRDSSFLGLRARIRNPRVANSAFSDPRLSHRADHARARSDDYDARGFGVSGHQHFDALVPHGVRGLDPCELVVAICPGGGQGRHLYAAASGAILSHCAFGASANVYFMLPIVVSYAAMRFYRQKCGVVSAVFAFGYLISCHVAFMSGDAWKNGGIDSTGSMMVLTLKVTSAAFNYQDGVIEDETSLRDSQKKYRLKALPSFLAYLGYCFNCGTHLVGPVFELRDYLDWTNNHGLWSPTASPPPPSPYTATFLATLKALVCMGLYMFLTGTYPLSLVTNPEFMKWGYWHRVWYQFLCGFGARWKYYFIWSLSEAAVIVSGFGFSGWSGGEEREPKPLWSRAQNVDIVNVELATSAAEIPKYWNIHVSVWLRHYVYERLSVKGERPGFKQLLATQVVSAVWHGLYTGYLIFFVNSALMISGSRVIYKWQQVIPKNNVLAVNFGKFVGFFYAAFVLNLTAIGFQVLYFADTVTAYRSVYYSGTLLPVALILFGKFVKPPRAGQTSKVKKEA